MPALAPVTTTTWSLLLFIFVPPVGRCRLGRSPAGDPRCFPLPQGRKARGALEQQGMDERLGGIAPHLALDDVEFLGQQPGRTARGAVPLEAGDRFDIPARLMGGQGQPEATQQESPLCFFEPAFV